ncbi:helix-turn-helix domain-containing protein [Laribacter hongkongensis]|uniref:XRE family transcriptional regulator n=1 Tax=Laribacter hongkongensis TaxID=168471 RepID=UPI001EFE5291|nr:LexA family transcriptional regulator [Laribacter hongkongensis]MCG8998136.1 helix-turn-helix domain-containing protein [Laribacter hongkongensis]MCG9062740.1 helix-turn-helix domain-containing protein [Laribacter hongkongensis]
MGIGTNIRKRRKAVGLTLEGLANLVNWDTGNLSRLERETQGTTEERLRQIAEALSTTVADLYSDSVTSEASEISLRPIRVWDNEAELEGEGYVFIPRLDIKASCGNGHLIWHIDEKGQRQAFRKRWCEQLHIDPSKAATIVAVGDSMFPRIQEGDSLVVDYTQVEVQTAKVYVIAFDGEWFIKRLFKIPGGGLRVVSDNENKTLHPDWDIKPDDTHHLQIIGRVVAVSGGV